MSLDFEKAKNLGIVGAKDFMSFDAVNGKISVNAKDTARRIQRDSATANNIGFPSAYYQYITPEIVPILFGAKNSAKFAPEMKIGSWTDDYMQFPVEDVAGGVTGYSDYQNGITSEVNYEFPVREQYRFQTVIRFGDLEVDKASVAKIGLIASKQRASAEIIAQNANRFNLFGVQGKKIYGLLNDPNLNSTISPISVGGDTTWADKMAANSSTFANIAYNDVNALWVELCSKNGGNIDANSPLKLALSNNMLPYLNAPNSFGLTAMQMLRDNFPNIEIFAMPDLSSSAGEKMILAVPELMGVETANTAYSEKYRLGRLIPHPSHFEQKASSTTWGTIIKRPSLIAGMLGI